MTDRSDLLGLVVHLAAANDAHVLAEPAFMRGAISPESRALMVRAAQLVGHILDHSDYVESPQFAAWTQGRSGSVIAMKIRMADDPVRRKEYRERLQAALEALPDSADAPHVVDLRLGAELTELTDIARKLQVG